MRVRINRGFLLSGLGLALLGMCFACLLTTTGVVAYYWFKYGRMIDEHLAGHIDQNTASIYAAPIRIFTGQSISEPEIISSLQLAGYGTSEVPGAPGWYAMRGANLEIHPEADLVLRGEERAARRIHHAQHTRHPGAGRWVLAGQRGNRAATADPSFRQLARKAATGAF